VSPAQFPKDTSVTAPITNSGTSANPQIGLDTSGLITGSKSSSTNQTVSGKLGVSQSGQNHALTASLTSTSGSDITALNVVSSNPDSSAVWISGKEYGHGTLKVSHVQPDGSDANASAVSINLTPNYDYQAVVGTASFASGTNSVSFTPSSGVPTVGQAFRGTGVVSTSTISAVSGSGPYTLTLSSATTGASDGGSYRSYTPTAVQGIYLDTYKSANGSDETSSGTTGTLLNLKNAGSQKLVLDSNGQLQLPQTSSTGGIRFGAGSTASSVYQSSSNILAVNNSALYARPNGTTLAAANETPALFTSAADNGVGPTKSPFTLNSKGKLEWGAEVAAADSPPATQKDVNLYRNAVGELKTDASLTVAGTVAPANLVVQPASNSTTSSLFKASDGATVLGIDTTNKVLTTSTQATTSGTALSSNNKLVDKAALTPAYISPSNVGEWVGLRRVVQSPLESGATNAGVSVLPPVLATTSVANNVVAGTVGTDPPSGRMSASWVYVPATINVQHVRFAYVTALPIDIQDVRVGIWNANSLTNYATSSNLVNATNAGLSGNTPAMDNSRFQTATGVSVYNAQSSAGTSLDVVCTNGRPVVNMQAINVTATNTATVTASTSITLSSVANLYVGQTVSGTGISGTPTITAINTGTRTITVSAAQTLSGTGVTLTFSTAGLATGNTIINVVALSGVTNGYTLTFANATTAALAAGVPLNLSPNKIIDTRRQLGAFANFSTTALSTVNPAFASPVSLTAGWWLVGVWNGGAAVAATPTLAASANQVFGIGVPMVDPNGPTSSGASIFKTGLAYADTRTLTSSVLPSFTSSASLTASTLYLDLTA